MNQISTLMKDRVLVFIGGNFKVISRQQEEAIYSPEVSESGSIMIDGDFVNLSTIARITSTDEFYAQNPSKRPAPKPNLFSGEKKFDWREEKRTEVIESMIRGIEKYIASKRYQGTDGPIKLLVKMKERLVELNLSKI